MNCTFKPLLTTAALLAATITAGTVQAAPLDYCPEDADVVARVNYQEMIDTPLAERLMDEIGEDNVETFTRFIENSTDFNLLEDIETVYLYAKAEQDEATIIVIEGDFQSPDKIVDLLRLSGNYEEEEVRGYDVHYWEDDGPKYASFVEDDVLLVAGSEDALIAAFEAENDKDARFSSTEAAALLPEDIDDEDAWVIFAPTHDMEGELGELGQLLEVAIFFGIADINDEGAVVSATAIPEDEELVDHYYNVARGLVSMGKLLRSELEILEVLVDNTQVRRTSDPAGVTATLEIAHDELEEIIVHIIDSQ